MKPLMPHEIVATLMREQGKWKRGLRRAHRDAEIEQLRNAIDTACAELHTETPEGAHEALITLIPYARSSTTKGSSDV